MNSKAYTLAQVMENLALMHGSQDLVWCRWVATDILERGIDAIPTAQAQSRTPLEQAAPELLEALKNLLVTVTQLRKHGDDYCFKWRNEPLDPCDCEICQAHSAIAKAKRGVS